MRGAIPGKILIPIADFIMQPNRVKFKLSNSETFFPIDGIVLNGTSVSYANCCGMTYYCNNDIFNFILTVTMGLASCATLLLVYLCYLLLPERQAPLKNSLNLILMCLS